MSGRWVAHDVLKALRQDPELRVVLASRLPGLELEQISSGLYTLKKRGLASVTYQKWRLTDAGVVAQQTEQKFLPGAAVQHRSARPSDRRTFRQRAWAALRRKKGKATIPDLMRVLEGSEKDEENLKCYLLILKKAGLVTALKRRARGVALTSPGHVVWTLNDDFGPLAPIWQTSKEQVLDPNTGKIYPLSGKEDGVS
ncbi:MAG: hypothetical protein HQL60_07815 [Magnetococcales bacterium]|nr:hypothetical protein [Magnetococcales bacterium]